MLLTVWSTDQQHQHLQGASYRCRTSGPSRSTGLVRAFQKGLLDISQCEKHCGSAPSPSPSVLAHRAVCPPVHSALTLHSAFQGSRSSKKQLSSATFFSENSPPAEAPPGSLQTPVHSTALFGEGSSSPTPPLTSQGECHVEKNIRRQNHEI